MSLNDDKRKISNLDERELQEKNVDSSDGLVESTTKQNDGSKNAEPESIGKDSTDDRTGASTDDDKKEEGEESVIKEAEPIAKRQKTANDDAPLLREENQEQAKILQQDFVIPKKKNRTTTPTETLVTQDKDTATNNNVLSEKKDTLKSSSLPSPSNKTLRRRSPRKTYTPPPTTKETDDLANKEEENGENDQSSKKTSAKTIDHDSDFDEHGGDEKDDDDEELVMDDYENGDLKKYKKRSSPRTSNKKKRKVIEESEDSDSNFDSDESDFVSSEEDETKNTGGDNDGDELKIDKILVSRTETLQKWKEIGKDMNTSEITNGSRWFQEEEKERSADSKELRYLIKWTDISYLHCSWENVKDLSTLVKNYDVKVKNFNKRNNKLSSTSSCFFNPNFVTIDRVLKIEGPEGEVEYTENDGEHGFGISMNKDDLDYEERQGRNFLIKWNDLGYNSSSYEYERDLIMMNVDYKPYVEDLEIRSEKPSQKELKENHQLSKKKIGELNKILCSDETERETCLKEYQDSLMEQDFDQTDAKLMRHQAEGISWIITNYVRERSSILADEMGLGKTVQTVVYLDILVHQLDVHRPHLVVVPLSTIPHWKREFAAWSDLNVIVYDGNVSDRAHIRELEFLYEEDLPARFKKKDHIDGILNLSHVMTGRRKNAKPWDKLWKMDVVITTPQMFMNCNQLRCVQWDVMVFDEASRIKNHNSKLVTELKEKIPFKCCLLLTGTPVQNNISELWTLMNFVDPKQFKSLDDFQEEFGVITDKEKLDELHKQIRPFMLRRTKHEVGLKIPPKEEIVIEVELTVIQKKYYRALYERNVKFLHRKVKKNQRAKGSSLRNLCMELRKVCNHPFLLDGCEDQVKHDFLLEKRKQTAGNSLSKVELQNQEAELLVSSCGKFLLLDKFLPKLKANGNRVLIFSQFQILLDVLEDYLNLRGFSYGRIDGNMTGVERQRTIDKFQEGGTKNKKKKDHTKKKDKKKSSLVVVEEEEPLFIMLLTTRAGGFGVNLTTADTVIIFDSDFNPQSDLQASARCHRIGQEKQVKIYRLISRKTYEMQMFQIASQKLGLDQAILEGVETKESKSGKSQESRMTKEEAERLLMRGAYDIFNEEKLGVSEKESKQFESTDIDTILEKHTRKIVYENSGKNVFSKAVFDTPKDLADQSEFWDKLYVDTQNKLKDSNETEEDDILNTPRKRTRTSTGVVYKESKVDFSGADALLNTEEHDSDYDAEKDKDDQEEDDDHNFNDNNMNGITVNDIMKLPVQKQKPDSPPLPSPLPSSKSPQVLAAAIAAAAAINNTTIVNAAIRAIDRSKSLIPNPSTASQTLSLRQQQQQQHGGKNIQAMRQNHERALYHQQQQQQKQQEEHQHLYAMQMQQLKQIYVRNPVVNNMQVQQQQQQQRIQSPSEPMPQPAIPSQAQLLLEGGLGTTYRCITNPEQALGLVFQTTNHKHRVIEVRAVSPLRDRVKIGDILLSINGIKSSDLDKMGLGKAFQQFYNSRKELIFKREPRLSSSITTGGDGGKANGHPQQQQKAKQTIIEIDLSQDDDDGENNNNQTTAVTAAATRPIITQEDTAAFTQKPNDGNERNNNSSQRKSSTAIVPVPPPSTNHQAIVEKPNNSVGGSSLIPTNNNILTTTTSTISVSTADLQMIERKKQALLELEQRLEKSKRDSLIEIKMKLDDMKNREAQFQKQKHTFLVNAQKYEKSKKENELKMKATRNILQMREKSLKEVEEKLIVKEQKLLMKEEELNEMKERHNSIARSVVQQHRQQQQQSQHHQQQPQQHHHHRHHHPHQNFGR